MYGREKVKIHVFQAAYSTWLSDVSLLTVPVREQDIKTFSFFLPGMSEKELLN